MSVGLDLDFYFAAASSAVDFSWLFGFCVWMNIVVWSCIGSVLGADGLIAMVVMVTISVKSCSVITIKFFKNCWQIFFASLSWYVFVV